MKETVNKTTAPSGEQRNGNKPCCEIPAFCRSYFYTGKLLTERDLTSDQRYFIDKMRLHYAALHGWGVVCGLWVEPHPQCLDRLVVKEGFAVDDCGREIRLLKDVVVKVPQLIAASKPQGTTHPYEDQNELGEHRERHEHKAWYVCLRYCETQEEFMPVPYDDCCSTGKKPNRVCEGYTIEVLEEPPSCLEHVQRHRLCLEEDCSRLYDTIPKECPPSTCECIPLALIRVHRDCEGVTEEMIDNSIRPIVPSARLLEQMIHCVEKRLPKEGRKLTRITYFNWKHDAVYSHHDFMHSLVGTAESPLGFVIEFDRRVHAGGLNSRTFQAAVVREPAESFEGHRFEIAPTRVLRSDDGLRCTLHLDPEFVRRHCHEHNFDLYLTLRCDKVVDEHGLPVDGNLHARLYRDDDRDYAVGFPTGDGTPGGLFESWIRVRRAR